MIEYILNESETKIHKDSMNYENILSTEHDLKYA